MRRILLVFMLFPTILFAEKHENVKPEKEYFRIGEFKEVHNPAWGVTDDPWCINDHTFIYDINAHRWHVIGITHSRAMNYVKDPGLNLLHISADSLFQTPWDIHPHALTANQERYKETLLWAPHCVYNNGIYYMYVCAGAQNGAHFHEQYQINLYTSTDLKSWSRYPGNPLFTDGFDARDPMILKDGDQWIMYYTANSTPAEGNHIVAAYTSKDLINWSNRTVVFTHSRQGTFGGPTESPFVVRRGENYYLFVCDGGHIDVYLSNDPFHFEEKNLIQEIFDCRASEIIRDVDGRDYISSVGWFNGTYGLKIAPIYWTDGKDKESTSLTDGYIFEQKRTQYKPTIDGDWWNITSNPDLGKFTNKKQQPVDFAIWQAADGTLQLWSCIRDTKAPGNHRLFYRWEAQSITDSDWKPMGIAMESDPSLGEIQGALQAPFVLEDNGKFYMFYGDWNRICLAESHDGKEFKRVLNKKGQPDLFTGPLYNPRDPMVIKEGNLYYCYYTAHEVKNDKTNRPKSAVFCRISDNLKDWSDAMIVSNGGAAQKQTDWYGGDTESPFVYKYNDQYILFRNQRYGTSNLNTQYSSSNPFNFGVNNDQYLIGTLNIAAPEIIKIGNQHYIVALKPTLDGIRAAKIKFIEE